MALSADDADFTDFLNHGGHGERGGNQPDIFAKGQYAKDTDFSDYAALNIRHNKMREVTKGGERCHDYQGLSFFSLQDVREAAPNNRANHMKTEMPMQKTWLIF